MKYIFEFALLLLLLFSGCKDHYNDMIEWTDNVEIGTRIEKVKEGQPDFITIDWNNPDSSDNKVMYHIKKIKRSRDILHMSHYLIFVDGKYQGRESHK